MPYQATIINNPIHLDPPAQLPEGARVEMRLLEQSAPPAEPTLTSLLQLAGTAKTLPSDMARNHDHYLHGAPHVGGRRTGPAALAIANAMIFCMALSLGQFATLA